VLYISDAELGCTYNMHQHQQQQQHQLFINQSRQQQLQQEAQLTLGLPPVPNCPGFVTCCPANGKTIHGTPNVPDFKVKSKHVH